MGGRRSKGLEWGQREKTAEFQEGHQKEEKSATDRRNRRQTAAEGEEVDDETINETQDYGGDYREPQTDFDEDSEDFDSFDAQMEDLVFSFSKTTFKDSPVKTASDSEMDDLANAFANL